LADLGKIPEQAFIAVNSQKRMARRLLSLATIHRIPTGLGRLPLGLLVAMAMHSIKPSTRYPDSGTMSRWACPPRCVKRPAWTTSIRIRSRTLVGISLAPLCPAQHRSQNLVRHFGSCTTNSTTLADARASSPNWSTAVASSQVPRSLYRACHTRRFASSSSGPKHHGSTRRSPIHTPVAPFRGERIPIQSPLAPFRGERPSKNKAIESIRKSESFRFPAVLLRGSAPEPPGFFKA
jgi:hypothetical protein